MDRREAVFARFSERRDPNARAFTHLKPFGYAPGGYLFTCADCGELPPLRSPIGDKRAWRCEPHAQTAYEQSLILGAANAAPTLDEAMCKPVTGRKGHFMRLASGTKFWPLDPRADEVFIDDIAAALSKLCRFNGHIEGDKFYSVAEHSVWCSYQTPPEFALEALLHDAAEAYTGDLIRPLKVIPSLAAAYKPIEELNETVITERFGLVFPFPAAIKAADEALCTRELRTIMAGADERAENQAVCNTSREAFVQLKCWEHREARGWFLYRFAQLISERIDYRGTQRQFLSPAARKTAP